jgi:hypothetical protein
MVLQYIQVPGRVHSQFFPSPTPIPPATQYALVGDDLVRREEVPIHAAKSGRVMVALAFGQSNSANHGGGRLACEGKVFNFYLGKLYRARDPLLGATGHGGSVWTRLGDMLIRGGLYDFVVFAPIGVGSSTVQRWAPGGDLHLKLLYTLRDLRAQGIPATHLLWHQGESDRATEPEWYARRFLRMVESIRRVEPGVPIYVSVATKTADGVSLPIEDAQRGLIDASKGIVAGPDTDTLDDSWRNAVDHTHFSEQGLQKCAELWLEALR